MIELNANSIGVEFEALLEEVLHRTVLGKLRVHFVVIFEPEIQEAREVWRLFDERERVEFCVEVAVPAQVIQHLDLLVAEVVKNSSIRLELSQQAIVAVTGELVLTST